MDALRPRKGGRQLRNLSPKTPKPISFQGPSGRRLARGFESSTRRGDIRKSNNDIHVFQESIFSPHSGFIPANEFEGNSADEGTSPVPNPIPDAGVQPTETFGYPLIKSTGNILSSSTLSHFIVTSHSSLPPPTFSPLPPLLSVTPSSSISAIDSAISSSSTEIPPTVNVLDTSTQHRALLQNKLATPIIILLAVASGCLFFGVCIIVKSCTGRGRRPRLKPSLPILENAYPDEDDFECKGSSIFGGKEQFSPAPGRTSTEWAWVQYPIPSLKPSALQTQFIMHDTRNREKYEVFPASLSRDLATQYPFNGRGHIQQSPTGPEPALQHGQRAVTRSAERVPTATVPTHSTQASIGLATMQGSVSIAEEDGVVNRSKTMRTSNSHSINFEQKRRGSGYGSVLAYDGADVSSPTLGAASFQPIATPVLSATPAARQEGRARVQSSYFVNRPYTRFSATPETYAIGTATKVNFTHAHARPIESEVNPVILTPDVQRDRQTEALTYALGISSPRCEYVVCAAQPTLYPEDLTHTENSSDSSAGSIVTMESGFSQISLIGLGSQLSNNLGQLGVVPENENTPKTGRLMKSTSSRGSDKPPRVPSPPPLPSLTQMGLEHANPEAYSNYRSPTYSIYGLYDGERKSGIGYY